MSPNRFGPHLVILPEDRANEELVLGFQGHFNVNERNIRVLEYSRGWENAVDLFLKRHVKKMKTFHQRLFMMLIDFDGHAATRRSSIQSKIPENLKDRVFVIGTESKPEALRRAVNLSLETIGETLAEECVESRHELWNHPLLQHNQAELARLRPLIEPFLFQNT